MCYGGDYMQSIDEYIKMSKGMSNSSDGGSIAYHFDDVVLVKYVMPSIYGKARAEEEVVAKCANELNKKGVNTPRHLAIKRERNDKVDICWVLQQRAPGICFSNYVVGIKCMEDAERQLVMQEKILNIPDSHYQKCILDLIELYELGIELKPKNIYYDEKVGFTIIDLLFPINVKKDSLGYIYSVLSLIRFVHEYTTISDYNDFATEEQKDKSKLLKFMIMKKEFLNLEKVIPDFSKYKRWILRGYSRDKLKFFEENGYPIGDLSLNDEEYAMFDELIEQIITDCLNKVASGENEYWEIGTNIIRQNLDDMKLKEAWLYHHSNKLKIEDFEDEYDYILECKYQLEKQVNSKFQERLLNCYSNNEFIIKAQQDMQEELERKRKLGM